MFSRSCGKTLALRVNNAPPDPPAGHHDGGVDHADHDQVPKSAEQGELGRQQLGHRRQALLARRLFAPPVVIVRLCSHTCRHALGMVSRLQTVQ